MRLKTERMVVISDILAWRDGRTDGRTYGRTDTASYRDAMDASKKMAEPYRVIMMVFSVPLRLYLGPLG